MFFVGRMSHFAVSSTRRPRRMAQSTWPERYASHVQAMLNDPEKKKLWEEYKARPEAVAEMPSGLFGQTSPIPEERAVGNRRITLLRKNHWTPDHQAFHDFYYERLKYDFRGDWERVHNP